MKTIALIHTVQKVAVTFGNTLSEILDEEVKIYNIWDEYLAKQPDEDGYFSLENKNRLFRNIKNAETTGADFIVVTCSTLTPLVKEIRPFIKVPVIAIDDSMGREAVKAGKKIFVLATAKSTIEPTLQKLLEEAANANKELELDSQSIAPAYDALRAMKMDEHDRILKEYAQTIKGFDCIVLAQASMAHLEEDISKIAGCPVFSSPRLCMQEIKERLSTIK